jgi:glycyl-tRNA synthetase alpha subunit
MTELLITALLSTDFDGYQFETLGNGIYSMTDDENTIVLKSVGEGWEVWVDGSLCIQGELEACIDWIGEYA